MLAIFWVIMKKMSVPYPQGQNQILEIGVAG